MSETMQLEEKKDTFIKGKMQMPSTTSSEEKK